MAARITSPSIPFGATFAAELAPLVARSALASMRRARHGQLFVPPQALAATKARIAEILADSPELEHVDVTEDGRLTAPNVQLKSPKGVV